MTDQATKERRRKLVGEHVGIDEFAGIGQVAVRAAVLDHTIEVTVSQIVRGLPEILAKKALGLSQPQMLILIQQELSKALPGHEAGIAAMIAEIEQARELRNKIVHSIWMSTSDPDKKQLVEPRQWKAQRPITTISVVEMKELADQMVDLAFEIGDWKMMVVEANARKPGGSQHNSTGPVRAAPR